MESGFKGPSKIHVKKGQMAGSRLKIQTTQKVSVLKKEFLENRDQLDETKLLVPNL